MKRILEYLQESTAEFIQAKMSAINQPVQIFRGPDDWFIVMDSPEFDLEWHRMSFRVTIEAPLSGVLTGQIEIERHSGTIAQDERQAFGFHRSWPFGEALNALEKFITTFED